MLQYIVVGERRLLVGVTYGHWQRPGAPMPEGFAGDADRWHTHDIESLVRRFTERESGLVRWVVDRSLARGQWRGSGGRTELAMSIFGRSWGQRISGEVRLHGKSIDVSTVEKAVRHGLAYVTEDRKGNGLVLNEDIQFNTSLANLPGVSFASVIDSGQEHRVVLAE